MYIGNLKLNQVEGEMRRQQPRLQILDRPGLDGQDYRDMGVKAAVSQITTEQYYADEAAAEAARADYNSLVGSYVAVTDYMDINYPVVMVLRVESTARVTGTVVTDTGTAASAVLVRAVWILQVA